MLKKINVVLNEIQIWKVKLRQMCFEMLTSICFSQKGFHIFYMPFISYYLFLSPFYSETEDFSTLGGRGSVGTNYKIFQFFLIRIINYDIGWA